MWHVNVTGVGVYHTLRATFTLPHLGAHPATWRVCTLQRLN